MSVRGAALAVAVAMAAAGCRADGQPRTLPPPPSPESLVRDGARLVDLVSGDLDGDGVREIVIASVSTATDELGLSTPYLEVFDVRDGRWARVFDATGDAPPGSRAPPEMLAPSDQGFVSQSVQALELVDFAGDGEPEIVVGIANLGATAGPLEVWVVSMAGDSAATWFYEASARGGELGVEGDRLRFEFGVYRKGDPGCCPSLRAVQTIGWNPATEGIEVLEQRRFPAAGGA